MSSPDRHPSDDELNNHAEGDADSLAQVTAHIATCLPCRKRAEEFAAQNRRLNALRTSEPDSSGPDCPGLDDWWPIARGLASGEEASLRLAHAARCGHCSRILRQTIEDLGAGVETDSPLIRNLPSSAPESMRKQAQRLAQASRIDNRRTRQGLPRLWLLAAALVIATVTGVLVLTRPSAGHVNGLLAQAYGENRPSELRFPGAPYGPIRQERGSGTVRPASLIEAEVAISKELSRHPADSRWLQLSGRDRLLGWHYDEAIASLNRAKTLAPADPSIPADLAAAYFERAQARGDAADYRTALDLLSEALQRDPTAAGLRFNRAIVLDHLSLNARAIEEWNEFLKLEPAGGWADEARARLAEVQRKAP